MQYKIIGLELLEVQADPNNPSKSQYVGNKYAKIKTIPVTNFNAKQGMTMNFNIVSSNDYVTKTAFLDDLLYSQYKHLLETVSTFPNGFGDVDILIEQDVFDHPTKHPFKLRDSKTNDWIKEKDGTVKIFQSIRVTIDIRDGIRLQNPDSEADRLVSVFGEYIVPATGTVEDTNPLENPSIVPQLPPNGAAVN